MALIISKPEVVKTETLDRDMLIGKALDEYFAKADLDHPYMEFKLRLPGMTSITDAKNNGWRLSSLIVGVVNDANDAGGLTFTDLKTTNSFGRKGLIRLLKQELSTVARNAKPNEYLYVELDKTYELRGIPDAIRLHTQFGETSRYTIVGVVASLCRLVEIDYDDVLSQWVYETNITRAHVLERERTLVDRDPLLTKDLLEWIIAHDRAVSLESLQLERDRWHKYLRGQKMVMDALDGFET